MTQTTETARTEFRQMGAPYLDWEREKGLVAGLRVMCLAAAVGCGLMLLADFLLFSDERPLLALPGPIARAALVLAMVIAALAAISSFSRRGEVSRPLLSATGVTLLAIAAGSLGAAAAGGFDGYYAYGLLPLLLIWTAAIPAGWQGGLLPVLGGVGLHLALLRLTVGVPPGPRATGLSILFGVLGVSVLALSEVVDRLRRGRTAASRIDPLTHVMHREGVLDELRLLCSRRNREVAPVSVVLFDLDRFRLLNLEFGRGFGDRILQGSAQLIRGSVRAHDLVGRYGPDEFMLVLDSCDGEHAVQLVERIRTQLLSQPFSPRKGPTDAARVSLSAGIVCAAAGVELHPDELRFAAERALQECKQAQLNRTVLGPPALSGALEDDTVASAAAPIPAPGAAAVIWNFPPPPANRDEAPITDAGVELASPTGSESGGPSSAES